jgi:hypothetical protein
MIWYRKASIGVLQHISIDKDKLIYFPDAAVLKLRERLGDLTNIAELDPTLDFEAMLDDLGARRIKRLMVEDSGTIRTHSYCGNIPPSEYEEAFHRSRGATPLAG